MPKSPRELVMPPVVYSVPGMDTVAVRSNLKYSSADHPLLLMDVYEAHANAPVVLLVHGSAPVETRPKDWGMFQSWGRLLAASGLTAAIVNHRMIHSDVEAAIDFAKATGVFVWSGGGPLLANLSPRVKCAAAFYAILDCPVLKVPTFVARAGRDEVPGVKETIDQYVSAAIAQNAPLTFVNHPSGEHGFDNQNDDDRSREIIRAAIEFLKEHLA
jgi:acetyl esterase/lipase